MNAHYQISEFLKQLQSEIKDSFEKTDVFISFLSVRNSDESLIISFSVNFLSKSDLRMQITRSYAKWSKFQSYTWKCLSSMREQSIKLLSPKDSESYDLPFAIQWLILNNLKSKNFRVFTTFRMILQGSKMKFEKY